MSATAYRPDLAAICLLASDRVLKRTELGMRVSHCPLPHLLTNERTHLPCLTSVLLLSPVPAPVLVGDAVGGRRVTDCPGAGIARRFAKSNVAVVIVDIVSAVRRML